MASVSERLALIIDFKGDAAIKGLEGVAKKSESADEKTRGLSDKLTKMGATGLAGSLVAAGGLGKLAMGASDLNEVVSKSRVLFGDASKSVEDFATNAARDIGQSKASALEAATTFANLGKNTGLSGQALADFSTDLVGLSSDLASFNNSSPEEAVLAIGAALRGEAEPIRAFGVQLDDATLKQRALEMGLISTTTGTLPPAIKMQAAYKEILEQTKPALGDFDRTSEGAANQQRILKAEIKNLADGIGAGLLPMFQGAVQGAAALVGKFNELSPATKSILGTIAGGATGVTAVVSAISLVAGQAEKMKGRFTDADGALNTFGQASVVAGAAVVGLTAVMAALHKKQEEVRKKTGEVSTKMREMGVSAKEASADLIVDQVLKHKEWQDALKRSGISIGELRDAVIKGGSAFEELSGRVNEGRRNLADAVESKGLTHELDLIGEAIKNLSKEAERNAEKQKIMNGAVDTSVKGLGEQRRAIQDNIDEHDDYAASLEQEKRTQENAKRATEELTRALEDQKKKNDDLYQSFLDAWSGQTIDLPKAIDDVRTSLLDYHDAAKEAEQATKDHGAASEEAQRAQIKFNDAGRGGYEAIQKYAQVALETEAARRGISVDALDASEKVSIQKQALEALKKDVPEYSGAIDQVSQGFDGIANAADTAAGKTEDASKRIVAAVTQMRNDLAGIFNSIDLGNGLSVITATADQLERQAGRIVGAVATYEKRNGPGWRT